MQNREVIFEMKNISKEFPGVKALDQVSVKIHKGTVHALMGENGAGKSTLMKCAFGIYKPDEGEILIDGVPVEIHSPRDAMDKGIAMIHQELHPIRVRSVMENIWVGRVPYKKVMGVKWTDNKKMYQDTLDLFEKLHISLNPKMLAGELSAAMCQLIEVARAVSYGAKIIIMDEPTSSLSETEVENLFSIIHQLTEQGTSIIYISHKMDEIMQISDEVSIMRDGNMVGTWDAAEIDQQFMIKKMVGRDMKNQFPPSNHKCGETILKVENLCSSSVHSFQDISFEVKKGEIFGIGGLVGAQRSELVESIFGLRGIRSGKIYVHGKEEKISCPQDAVQCKIALLTEERRATGIIPMLSIVENTIVANQTANTAQYRKFGPFLDKKKREEDTRVYVDKMKTKTPSLKTQIQYLSGGNQQKVLLGRWLLTEPDILILDEPTRGIDVGAKYEIYCLMEEMVQKGKSIIMISSEMPELIGMADRIMVMCEGHASGLLNKEEISDVRIMELASSYQKEEQK